MRAPLPRVRLISRRGSLAARRARTLLSLPHLAPQNGAPPAHLLPLPAAPAPRLPPASARLGPALPPPLPGAALGPPGAALPSAAPGRAPLPCGHLGPPPRAAPQRPGEGRRDACPARPGSPPSPPQTPLLRQTPVSSSRRHATPCGHAGKRSPPRRRRHLPRLAAGRTTAPSGHGAPASGRGTAVGRRGGAGRRPAVRQAGGAAAHRAEVAGRAAGASSAQCAARRGALCGSGRRALPGGGAGGQWAPAARPRAGPRRDGQGSAERCGALRGAP